MPATCAIVHGSRLRRCWLCLAGDDARRRGYGCCKTGTSDPEVKEIANCRASVAVSTTKIALVAGKDTSENAFTVAPTGASKPKLHRLQLSLARGESRDLRIGSNELLVLRSREEGCATTLVEQWCCGVVFAELMHNEP